MSQFQSATWTESGLRRVQANVVLRLRNSASAQLLRKAENQDKFRKRAREVESDESTSTVSIFSDAQLDSEFSINFEFMWLKRFEDLVSQGPSATSTVGTMHQKGEPSPSAAQATFLVPNPYRRKGTSLHDSQLATDQPPEPAARPQSQLVAVKNGPLQQGMKDTKGEGSTVTVKTLGIFRLPPKLPWFDDIRSSADLFFLSRCRVEPELMEKAKAAVEKAKNTRTGENPPSQSQRRPTGTVPSLPSLQQQDTGFKLARGKVSGFPEVNPSRGEEDEVFQVEAAVSLDLPSESEELALDGPNATTGNVNSRKRGREPEAGADEELSQYFWNPRAVPERCARLEGLAMSNRRRGLVNGVTPFPSVVGPGMLNLPPYGLIAFGRARLQIPSKPAPET